MQSASGARRPGTTPDTTRTTIRRVLTNEAAAIAGSALARTSTVPIVFGDATEACLVTDGAGALEGVLHIHDCIRAGALR